MEASLAHRKAIAISFPFNGWGSWTDDDIATAVQVSTYMLCARVSCHHHIVVPDAAVVPEPAFLKT